MEASNYCIISTTTDTKENATIISASLLNKELVACVQSSVTQSAYKWQEKIVESEEILIHFKTKKSLFDAIKKEILAVHTYDVPEIIMVPLLNANIEYLQWIDEVTCGSCGSNETLSA